MKTIVDIKQGLKQLEYANARARSVREAEIVAAKIDTLMWVLRDTKKKGEVHG